MGSNGKRRPRRPQIQLAPGAASEQEGAAIAAALERFCAEQAPAPQSAEVSRWQQAALREGVLRDPGPPGRGAA